MPMDRQRTKSRTAWINRAALVVAGGIALVGGGVTLANIDFRTQRVDRSTLSIETVQLGTMEIKAAANDKCSPEMSNSWPRRYRAGLPRRTSGPGALVQAGQVLVEAANPQLTASADEAQSAWEGAVAELQAADAELQTNLMNEEVALTQVQFNAEKAEEKLKPTNLWPASD